MIPGRPRRSPRCSAPTQTRGPLFYRGHVGPRRTGDVLYAECRVFSLLTYATQKLEHEPRTER